MKWFTRGKSIEKERLKGIELGTKIIHMQFQLGGCLPEFYSRSHSYYSLGYCFGVYQAGLEIVKTGDISGAEYDAHIRQGFAATFLSERVGNENFDGIRRHIYQAECNAGREDGISEYVTIYKNNSERPYALAQFLLSGER